MDEQVAFQFGERYLQRMPPHFVEEASPVLTFKQGTFPEQHRVTEKEQRNLYLTNLTAALYTFYGGNVAQIAALETPEDSFTTRYGITLKKREHYPEQPGVSVETCRTLAEMILDANEYEEAVNILRWHDKEGVKRKMNEFLAPYVQQTENLELRRIYGSDLERRVA